MALAVAGKAQCNMASREWEGPDGVREMWGMRCGGVNKGLGKIELT